MRWLSMLLVVLTTLVFWSVPTQATDADFAGDYTWIASPAAEKALAKAIDEAVKPMNFLIRGIARGRLTDTSAPYKTINMVVKGNKSEYIRLAHQVGVSVVLVDYDPNTQQYGSASEIY